MARTTLKLLGVSSLLVSPAVAQFGMPNKKKPASFEEINEMAKQQQAGGGGLGDLGAGLNLDALKNMDMGEMQKMMEQAMKDPAMMEQMGAMTEGVGEAMKELANMSPEDLQKQMMEGLSMLTSGDIMDGVMGKKDEVLEALAAQGLVPKEKVEAYRNDPELFEKEMKGAFDQMKDIFSDPDTLNAATKMMKDMSEVMGDPEKAMRQIAETMKDTLGDDDKIEEARLELLSDPKKAGNPMLAEMFNSDEMKDILEDPVKWREQVKKGQGMLLNDAGAEGGARVGEL